MRTRLSSSQIRHWSRTPRTQWSREEVGFPLITIIVASKTTCGDILFETLNDELAWRSLSRQRTSEVDVNVVFDEFLGAFCHLSRNDLFLSLSLFASRLFPLSLIPTGSQTVPLPSNTTTAKHFTRREASFFLKAPVSSHCCCELTPLLPLCSSTQGCPYCRCY